MPVFVLPLKSYGCALHVILLKSNLLLCDEKQINRNRTCAFLANESFVRKPLPNFVHCILHSTARTPRAADNELIDGKHEANVGDHVTEVRE